MISGKKWSLSLWKYRGSYISTIQIHWVDTVAQQHLIEILAVLDVEWHEAGRG